MSETAQHKSTRPRGLARFTSLYGASPLHLLAMLGTLVVAGYAAKRVHGATTGFDDPVLRRYALWFLGAAIVHDLVLAPAYIALDRGLSTLRSRLPSARPGVVNYVRFPAVISGTLLLTFWSGISGRSEGSLTFASGDAPDPYWGRWLVVTAVLFAVSALLYVVNLARSARR